MLKDRQELAARRPDIAYFERQVTDLSRLLAKGRFVTVEEVMACQGCSKVAAHRRIRALEGRGYRLQTAKVRQGLRGPEATGYAIVKVMSGS